MAANGDEVRVGMTVFSSDGEKLGKVVARDDDLFTIEKGFFFRTDYRARLDDVAAVDGDRIRLRMIKDTFLQLREAGLFEPIKVESADYGADYGIMRGFSGESLSPASSLRMDGEEDGGAARTDENDEEAARAIVRDPDHMARVPPRDDT